MIRLLLVVVQYNDFINSTAVSKGWIIVRDVFNMFFVLVLLVIAFATVLKIEKYSYKRLLGGFLLAAVLVNFSKLICGIFIDLAQILMLTFVNAFKAVGEGNLIQMLGIESLMNLRKEVGGQDLDKEIVGALLLGLIMTIIALFVVGIITIIFVFRIVILWFLVLLSPLAFMASVLPVFQKYANQWWEKFTSQLIIGPVLAFFLWLSFAMVSEGDVYKNVIREGSSQEKQIEGVITEEKLGGEAGAGASKLAASASEAGKPQFVLNFIIGIAMLIGSLMVAQQMGVAGGKLAGAAVGKMQAVAKGAGKLGLKGIDRTLEKTGKAAVRGLGHVTGSKGLQGFQGISYNIAKDALRQRKQEKVRQRKNILERAAAPLAEGLDRNLDPGVWAKRVGDTIYKSKKKTREATKKKDEIDMEIKDINVKVDLEKTNLEHLNQEKDNTARLEGKLSGSPILDIKKGMSTQEINDEIARKKSLMDELRVEAKEAAKKTGEDEEYYNINTVAGRLHLKYYLKKKSTGIDDKISDTKKKRTDLQAEKGSLTEQSREQVNIISTEKYRPGVLGISERERLPLAEIEARKRQAETNKDVMLTTGGEEALLIEELKKAIARNNGDRAIASLELLTKVNGHNAMMLDHSIQGQVRELIRKKYSKTDEQGNNLAVKDFDEQPVNLPAIRLFYEHIAKNVARLNDYEAARSISRIGAIGGMAGNYAMPGIAYIDPLTGLPSFGGIVQKEDGGLDMDKQWATTTRYRANQNEPQTFWRSSHSSTFATEDKEGAGGHLHAGGREYLANISGKDIAQMIRMRDDTLTRLNKKEVIVDIRNFADEISKGLIKGVNKQQAVLVNTFADRLIQLKTEVIAKK